MKNLISHRTFKVIFILISINAFSQSGNFKIKNPYYSRTDTKPLKVSNAEWKILKPELYQVAREAATETAFTGKYYEFDEKGTYYCSLRQCFIPFNLKFATTCGWPSLSACTQKQC
jgi:peptide-methionine (R)-S-oxide reductase